MEIPYKITTKQIVKLEDAASALSIALYGSIDIPVSALDALRAHYDGIIAIAAMLRDRDEMTDALLEARGL